MTLPSTGYCPVPGRTDSEYNDLRDRVARQAETIRILTEQRDRLQRDVDNLNAHLQADHEVLKNTREACQARTERAADDGPEAVFFDWHKDEDSTEYDFPPAPRTIDSV